MVTDRGFPIMHDRRIVMLHKISVWSSSDRSAPRPSGPQSYNFSFPLPTYARQRGTLLPPTTCLSFPSVELDVKYSINIDMVRQGFHRHECTSTPILYLPRSVPTSLRSLRTAAGYEEVEAKAEVLEEVDWRMVDAVRTSKDVVDGETIVQVLHSAVTALVMH